MEPELPRAVLDSSVLIPSWSRFVLQRLAATTERRYQPVWSEWIIAETWYVLADRAARDDIARVATSVRAKRMLRYFLSVMDLVSVANVPEISGRSPLRDPDDAEIWATAVLGQARYVISHNTNDFPPLVQATVLRDGQRYSEHRHAHDGVEFLTAIEFIEDVLGEDVAAILGRLMPERGVIRSRRAIAPF